MFNKNRLPRESVEKVWYENYIDLQYCICICNATQRNAYQNYILNNNFKFYIYQFFRALKNLSVFIRFAKIISFIKESKSSYFFEWQKSKQKTISFFIKKRNKAKARFQRKTPFRIRNLLVKTFLQYSESPSLRGFAKNRSNLFSGLLHFVRNDKFKISNDGLKNLQWQF